MKTLVWTAFPVAFLSALLVLGFPGHFAAKTHGSFSGWFHILLSIVTSAVLVIAGVQALLLAIQERLLRFAPNGNFIQKLPPLITMEKILFQTIVVGFILLSVLLLSSVYTFFHLLEKNYLLWQKTILVMGAWVVFAVLLLGRFVWGWRGRKAIYGTFFGVLLLIVVYFGSQFILKGWH